MSLAAGVPASLAATGEPWLDLLGEALKALAVPILGLVILWIAFERIVAVLARLATMLLGRRDPVVAAVRTGREGMRGLVGVARTELAPKGKVFVRGELWDAVCEEAPVAAGRRVEVIEMEGLALRVRPRSDNEDDAGPGKTGALREEVPCPTSD